VIDETKVKVEGRWYYLWAAIDTDNREVLGGHTADADARWA
jgi:transposase-like protein